MSIDALAVIRLESQRLAEALAGTDAALRVPTCPAWSAADLLWHLAEVQGFWAAVLARGATSEEEVRAIQGEKVPRPDGTEALLARREAATAALLDQLAAHADEEPAWFWYSPEQTVGATRRMQTHEAVIHRVDAELTAGGAVSPIDAEIALDSLEHVLGVMWPARAEWVPQWATVEPVAVVEVRPEVAPRRLLGISRWSGTRPADARSADGMLARVLEQSEVDPRLPRAAASGSALALALWAWGRPQALAHLPEGPAAVEVLGDAPAIGHLEALLAAGHD